MLNQYNQASTGTSGVTEVCWVSASFCRATETSLRVSLRNALSGSLGSDAFPGTSHLDLLLETSGVKRGRVVLELGGLGALGASLLTWLLSVMDRKLKTEYLSLFILGIPTTLDLQNRQKINETPNEKKLEKYIYYKPFLMLKQ